MQRHRVLGLAALVGPLSLSGCASAPVVGDDWFPRDGGALGRLLGWEDDGVGQAPKLAAANLATAERVETVGRTIIAWNTFTGLDPLFHTVGKPDPELFHRGTAELFISQGLVDRCRTDTELAAVLCWELGAMMAEQRAAAAHGRDSDGITNHTPAATAGTEVGAAVTRRTVDPAASPDALARDLLRGAGYDAAELDRVRPLLGRVARGGPLEKQVAGSAAAPVWEK